jgi:hypothetical protein
MRVGFAVAFDTQVSRSILSTGEMPMSSVLDVLVGLLGGALAGEALHRATERATMLKRWLEQHRSTAKIERFLAAEVIRAHPDLYSYLGADLNQSSMILDGHHAEMMTRALGDQKLQIPVAVIGTKAVKLLPFSAWTIDRSQAWNRLPFIRMKEKLGRVIQDNPCYSASAITVSSGVVSVLGGLTTYGTALAAQDILEWEFLDQGYRYLSKHRGRLNFEGFSNLLGVHLFNKRDLALISD